MAAAHWTSANLTDLSGRTVVVTGGSGGLGSIIAAELARVGAQVTLAVRDVNKGRAAAKAMAGRIEVRPLDLADLASVRAFAADWPGDLDVLINNAGIMQDGFRHLRGYPKVIEPPQAARHPDLGQQLWELSARLTDTNTRQATDY